MTSDQADPNVVISYSGGSSLELATTSLSKRVATGWYAIDSEDLASAVARFREALSEDPQSPDALFGLAYASELLGQAERAVQHYCQILLIENSGLNRVEAERRLRALGRDCE